MSVPPIKFSGFNILVLKEQDLTHVLHVEVTAIVAVTPHARKRRKSNRPPGLRESRRLPIVVSRSAGRSKGKLTKRRAKNHLFEAFIGITVYDRRG